MSLRRKVLISVIFLVAVAAVALVLYLRSSRPPEVARLLPEGDVILYANLKPAHLWDLAKSTPVPVEGDYRNFVAQTGIQFERDLNEVAMSRRATADGKDTESSEVFAGHFDQQKLTSWLENISTQRDSYHGHMLYLIPHEGHTVRVCVLDKNHVAVTNMSSSDPMHEIIDAAEDSPGGPSLLQSYYKHIPVATLGWALVRTGSDAQTAELPSGWNFDFLADTVTVGSVRYDSNLLLRADVIAATEDAARQVADSAGAFLSMYRTVAQSVGTHGTDPDVKAALDSIQVQQNKKVATFTATLSQRFLKKLVLQAGPQAAPPAASPSPAPVPRQRSRRHHSRHKPMARPTPPAG
ncbi:MAG TPA: hypothetical protein VFP59_18930 [Candidatus Angelobacter sp.]|nr:hypothetical protein [Candidatus Angelobacter sp.]